MQGCGLDLTYGGKVAEGENAEQTRLAACSIANDDEFPKGPRSASDTVTLLMLTMLCRQRGHGARRSGWVAKVHSMEKGRWPKGARIERESIKSGPGRLWEVLFLDGSGSGASHGARTAVRDRSHY